MKQILLMRHGNAQHYINDFTRSLNELGRQSVIRASHFLSEFTVDKILCSPSARTVETLDIIKSICSINESIINIDDRLYETSAEIIFHIVKHQADEVQSLLIIGHHPSLCNFGALTAKKLQSSNFTITPAGVVIIQYPDIDTWAKLDAGTGKIYSIFLPT